MSMCNATMFACVQMMTRNSPSWTTPNCPAPREPYQSMAGQTRMRVIAVVPSGAALSQSVLFLCGGVADHRFEEVDRLLQRSLACVLGGFGGLADPAVTDTRQHHQLGAYTGLA